MDNMNITLDILLNSECSCFDVIDGKAKLYTLGYWHNELSKAINIIETKGIKRTTDSEIIQIYNYALQAVETAESFQYVMEMKLSTLVQI